MQWEEKKGNIEKMQKMTKAELEEAKRIFEMDIENH